VNRRNFILLSGGATVAIAIPTVNHFFGKISYPGSLAEPNSLTSILDFKELKELGKAYRAQVPEESTERTLAKLLSEKLPDEKSKLNSTVKNLVEKDFESGNTIEINGWILSKTEARQCALFSFSPQ